MAREDKLSLIAIDEAHLISSWKSFRPQYGYLIHLSSHVPNIPLMALTATATPDVRNLLLSSLSNPVLEVATVNKPNIFLQAVELSKLPKNGTQSYYTSVANHLSESKRAIVYTDFVYDVAPIAIALTEKGINSWSYHGKNMSSHDKLKAVDTWSPEDSNIQVMVCTTAFGMGVDVPNVDLVVRIGCPPSLEELVQEFGRAGRDGRQAKGINFSDSNLQHALFWCKDKSEEDQHTLLRQFQEVWRFALAHHNGICRRQVILKYFEEELKVSDYCCDVCSQAANTETKDCLKEVTAIITAVKEIPNKGEKKIAEWLRGYSSKSKHCIDVEAGEHSTSFGMGASLGLGLSESAWRVRIRQAWLCGFLERSMQFGRCEGRITNMVFNSYTVSIAGEELLTSSIPVYLVGSRS